MRFYDIVAGPLHFTSLGANGYQNPAALNIELDVTLQAHDVASSAYVRVWGAGIDVISQAQNLYGQPFKLLGGMSRGLPLAMPQQAGVICSGKIFRAWGNCQGIEQTLDMVISATGVDSAQSKPGPNPITQTKPITFNAPKGTPFGDAIQRALQGAYPDLKVDARVDPGLKAQTDQVGYHSGIESFAHYLRRYTQMLSNDVGVSLHTHDGVINVFDGSSPTQGGQIAYTDLIGQPTWIGPGEMSFKVVMRADIHVGDTITLPQTLVATQAGGGPRGSTSTGALPSSLTFQGDFTVSSIHHLGNFRQPGADDWVTVITAYQPLPASSGGQSSGDFSSGTY